MVAIPRFGKRTEKAFINTPDVWWAPIEPSTKIYKGMVFRRRMDIAITTTETDTKLAISPYGIITSSEPSSTTNVWGYRGLSGTRSLLSISVMDLIKYYEHYIGPREKNGLPTPPSKRSLDYQPLVHTGCPKLCRDTLRRFKNTPPSDWGPYTIADLTPGTIVRWEKYSSRDDYYFCITNFERKPNGDTELKYTALHTPYERVHRPAFGGALDDWGGGFIITSDGHANPQYRQYIGPVGSDRLPPLRVSPSPATLSKYMNTPPEQWMPIESANNIYFGMVARDPRAINNPASYIYIMSDIPNADGTINVKGIDGKSKLTHETPQYISKIDYYTGVKTDPTPSRKDGGRKPIPPPSTSPPETVETPKEDRPPKPRTKQTTFVMPEEDPIKREQREKHLIDEIAKRQEAAERKRRKALDELDHEKVAEEKRLLQAACLALAYAFGKDAPDACDTQYADIIQHMAADVVLDRISHQDAIAAITKRIRADAEEKQLDGVTKDVPDESSQVIDSRLTKVERDIENLGTQISKMTTHMESVLKRWEAISPFIPRNVIRYYDASKTRKTEERGGVIGISSFETGKVEKIPTDKKIGELSDTEITYIKNGLCIHFNQPEAEAIHAEVAAAMGTTPESLWGYNYDTGAIMFDESDEPGYKYIRCFDLTRQSTSLPYRAAGGRIKHPKRMVNRIKGAVGDRALIVTPPGVDLA